MKQTIRRADIGWHVFASVRTAGRGWRQIGPDAAGIMDDFGNLVLIK